MSSIYGLFSNSHINDHVSHDSIVRMTRWNKAFGTDHQEMNDESYILGGFLERLNDSYSFSHNVCERGNTLAAIDALLYNRKELIDQVQADSNISDEQLLLEYIDRFGFDALAMVNGDFSGAIYDKDSNKLTLFRDHMGVRPLYYYCGDDFFLLSTDIRGITAVSEADCAIREGWVYNLLSGNMSMSLIHTEYEHIFCVRPGSYMEISFDAKITWQEKVYWAIGQKKIKLSSDRAYQEKMRELIEDSIKRRLDAVSGRVGAELSGGLDSGVIDILINRMGKECLYYSWSRSPETLEMAENDERLRIQDICAQENITCNYGVLDIPEDSTLARKTFDTGIARENEGIMTLEYALPAFTNTYNISQTAEYMNQNGVKAIFTGHGGDEGVSHRANPYEMFHYHEYYHYFRYMFSTTNGLNHRIYRALRYCWYNLTTVRKAFSKPFTGDFDGKGLFNSSFASKADVNIPPLYFAYDPIRYIQNGGSRNRLDNIALQGAYNGVRYMVPYLDYRVVDFAVSIPRYQYLRGRKDRYIFREAFKDIIPDSLYRYRIKEDLSHRSLKPDPDWFESFNENKKNIIRKINRDYWKKYLDFDMIDKWEKSGEPSGDDKDKEYNMLMVLNILAHAQNAVEKSRLVQV